MGMQKQGKNPTGKVLEVSTACNKCGKTAMKRPNVIKAASVVICDACTGSGDGNKTKDN